MIRTSKKSGHITPLDVYKALYNKFGPQGWWPVTRGRSAVPEYCKKEYCGKNGREKFEICAGAILTQNTSWKNVERALENLARADVLSPFKIRGLNRKKLASLIRPSGYYNQKAARLKGFAKHICDSYGGKIEKFFDRPPEELREKLLSLKGVGPETADSILLYAAEKLSFVIDAYTMRLGSRLGWFGQKASYDEARGYLISSLPRSLKLYNEFHALAVALGKDICKIKPLCQKCALKDNCKHEQRHRTRVRRKTS